MNTYDELKLAIYESFENEYISESEKDFLLDYITEKKTREEYRIASFKKKYDFKPDKPGAKTGTILVNGKRQRVDFEKSDMINIKGFKGDEDSQKSVRQTAANVRDKDGTIKGVDIEKSVSKGPISSRISASNKESAGSGGSAKEKKNLIVGSS